MKSGQNINIRIEYGEENLKEIAEYDIDEFNKSFTDISPNMNEAIKNVISSYDKYLTEYLQV